MTLSFSTHLYSLFPQNSNNNNRNNNNNNNTFKMAKCFSFCFVFIVFIFIILLSRSVQLFRARFGVINRFQFQFICFTWCLRWEKVGLFAGKINRNIKDWWRKETGTSFLVWFPVVVVVVVGGGGGGGGIVKLFRPKVMRSSISTR